ncbi:MAG: FHA domain-containing protein [Clostridiales Family XIII bacterium]|jgi:hypothetical protein|nr:FHA domain-containing protein [Clostridiales Family XIII bacterium]
MLEFLLTIGGTFLLCLFWAGGYLVDFIVWVISKIIPDSANENIIGVIIGGIAFIGGFAIAVSGGFETETANYPGGVVAGVGIYIAVFLPFKVRAKREKKAATAAASLGSATPLAPLSGNNGTAPPPKNRPRVSAPAHGVPASGHHADVPQVMFKSPTADNPAGLPTGFEELDGDTMVLGTMKDDGATTLLDAGGGSMRAFLVREDTGEEILINKPQFTIGRSKADVDYCVADRTVVSRVHAVILSRGDKYYLIDLNSNNKTYINNNALIPNHAVKIQSGAHVRLANVGFVFHTRRVNIPFRT